MITVNSKLLVLRIIGVITSVFGISYRLFIDPVYGPGWKIFFVLGHFSVQSTILVMVIFILLLINQVRGTPEKAPSSAVRGAALLYIFVTFAIFLGMYRGNFGAQGISKIVLFSSQLLLAILMMADNILSIKPHTYKWKLLGYWLIYPTFYLIFLIFESVYFNTVRIYFLNFKEMGIDFYFVTLLMMFVTFAGIGALIIFINIVYRKPIGLE
ncbi:MAG: Pr6Pr family membrane protein [Candidatus Marinimicrobia bacterium]|nr:Pr6Pr family membrane protein [Candidatus Neomarinimicrobiota bacterium]